MLEISGRPVIRDDQKVYRVARGKKQRTTQPKVGNKLIIKCTDLRDGFVLSMSDSVKLIIINLPQLSIFLCFRYLSILQNIARYENFRDKHKVACLRVGIKIKDAILNTP